MDLTIVKRLNILREHGFPEPIIEEFIGSCLEAYWDSASSFHCPPPIYTNEDGDLLEEFYNLESAYLDYGLQVSKKLTPLTHNQDEDEDRFSEMNEDLTEAFEEVIEHFKLSHLHMDILSFRDDNLPNVEIVWCENSPLQEVW